MQSGNGTAGVRVALHEALDDRSTLENSGARRGIVNSGGDTSSHVDIVKDEGAVGTSLGSDVAGVDTDGRVADLGVQEENRAHSLGGDAGGHIQTDLAVVDGDVLESPSPVPVHEDGSVASVEGQVAGGELLVAKESTVTATVEGQIAHETSRAIVHEDTLLRIGRGGVGVHVENNVLQ